MEFIGSDGNDSIEETGIIFGKKGNDILSGREGNDTIYGGKDNDTIYGNGGNDFLRGDLADDLIYGGEGNDTIYGGKGNDTIYGDGGSDLLFGDSGDDIIYGGEGDTLTSGEGNDTFFGIGAFVSDFSPGDRLGEGLEIKDGFIRATLTPTPRPSPTPAPTPAKDTLTGGVVTLPGATETLKPGVFGVDGKNGKPDAFQIGTAPVRSGQNPVGFTGLEPGDSLLVPVTDGYTVQVRYFEPGSSGATNARAPEGITFIYGQNSAGLQNVILATVKGGPLGSDQIKTFQV